jgi:signal transduction histidine kinase
MAKPVKVLIVEDSQDDADMLLAELRRAGFEPTWSRVETEADFLAAIKRKPDIIFSDFAMPRFTGMRAADLLHESGLEIPFILISGTVGEEVAVQAMQHGATDYLLKDRITRLGSAAERALEQKRLRDEYRKTEEEVRWKTALLEAQVDSAMDGMVVVDGEGRKIIQNQRLVDLLKIPHEIAANEYVWEQVRQAAGLSKNPDAYMEKVNYLYAHPDDVSQDEIELVDGRTLERYSSPVRDKQGRHYGRIWTFRDITERRKLEMQLRQAQKMEAIGQLAGGVAHDFNNILAVILMQAGLLKSEESANDAARKFADEIAQAAERAANLTRQLLLFSRQQAMQTSNFDLNETVTNMTKMLQRLLGEDVHMQFKLSPVPLLVHADAGMMDQILLNLTVNARDAMPAGGQLVIETSAVEFDAVTSTQSAQARPGSFACLSVTDNGSGIPAEILPRIFEPFFTTKDVGKGSGLGLATVFGILQQHQGWINVYSEIGQGTTFRLYLPRLAATFVSKAVDLASTPIVGGHETILLVEDDVHVRFSVRTALSIFGYQVLEAATGAEALEIWRRHGPEIRLLLTDLVLPGGMTGRQLAEQLLQLEPGLKVIYSSGYSSELASRHISLEDGVNFLAKPFEAQKLAHTIRRQLDVR